VVMDDIALPFGTIRLRAKGSDAGHNGLKDINKVLGTSDYPRLRFGISNNYPKGRQVDYVLSSFDPEEATELPVLLDKSVQAIQAFAALGVERAMNEFNG
jgi:peptidyl-tRNA hydrolase, PTH1 family